MLNTETLTQQGLESHFLTNNNTDSPETVDQGAKNNHFADQWGLNNPENYLIGVTASRAQNRVIYQARQRLPHNSYDDWRIIDGSVVGTREKKTFYKGRINENGDWIGRQTELNRGRRSLTGIELNDADIREKIKSGNGVWHFPMGLYRVPKNDGFVATNSLTAEFDNLDPNPENWEHVKVLNLFNDYGFPPNLIVSSGGKCNGLSPHTTWFFDKTIDEKHYLYGLRILQELGADPHTCNKVCGQYRVAGFPRPDKGKEQGLFKEFHDNFYTFSEWVNTAIQIGKDLGIKITKPQEFHQEYENKKEKEVNSNPIDLSQFDGSEIEKALVKIDSQCPIYESGNGTYLFRFILAGAVKTLVGTDRAKEICPRIFSVDSIGWNQLKPCKNPIKTINNQMDQWIGKGNWEKPEIFKQSSILDKALDFKEWLKKKLKRVKPKGFGVPKVEGEIFTGDRAKAWQETEGDILDNSFCGSGKSHAVPDLECPPGHKLWYVYKDHRNPTVEGIGDKFADLYPRNKHGFYIDKDDKLKTANEDTPSELITIKKGYCPNTDLFHKATESGHNPYNDGNNPICPKCPYLNQCRAVEGWYLKDRRDTLENESWIRCHIDSMPPDWDYSKDKIIFDEPAQLLNPIKVITANQNDLYADLGRLQPHFSDTQSVSIFKILGSLKPLFDDKSRYGNGTDKINESLREIDKPNELESIIKIIEENPLDFTDYIVESDDLDLSGLSAKERQKYRGTVKTARANMRGKAHQQSKENLDKIPPNALIHILKFINGEKGISISVAHGTLRITLDNRDSYSFLHRTEKNIYLDATQSLESLKMMIGGDRPITAIHSEMPQLTNLEIVQIKVKGIGSKDISETAVNRIKKIKETLGEMPTIGHKSWQELLDIDGYWFNHNRGSNDFKEREKMLYLGLPRPHWGIIQDEYYCLNGSLEGFEEHYQTLINREIVQGIGRQRANLYPNQKFTLYIATPENYDLSWLSQYGCQVTVKSGFDIHPEAGSETEKTLHEIQKTAKALWEKGVNLTQAAIAEMMGVTQQAISKALAKAGLTIKMIEDKLKAILPKGYTTSPNKDPIRSGCIPDQLYDGFREFFDLDPLLLVEDAVKTITEHGLTYFWEEYLSFMPNPLQAKYLTGLWFLLQDDDLSEAIA